MSLEFVAPGTGPWPLHDTAASRAAEAQALAKTAEHELMQRAGLATAGLALALAPHARRFVIFAGPGNNGGDGWVAATRLHEAGHAVLLCFTGDANRLPADATLAMRQAQAAGVPQSDTPAETLADELAIDALLGLGTKRAPDGPIAAAIEAINRGAAPVLSVDLPSGLHADTGQPLGDSVVRAQTTLSLLTLKPGLFTGRGRDLAGAIWLDRLGVENAAGSAELPSRPRRLVRHHADHKGSFGDVAVVGGAPGMLGAAWLAARAALAAGAGRVYCSPLDEQAGSIDAARPEIMVRRRWWALPAPVLHESTVVCGCGGGSAVREALPPLLSHGGRLVLDADALNTIAADTALQNMLAARASRTLETVLTPHPLEAARLMGSTTSAVQADRIGAATQLAARFACTVVLKGSGSVVASPGVLPSINPSGNALLASAGTGDVLAGWLGGLWAAGAVRAHDAAVAAVWIHGRAADRALAAGRHLPWRAADLIEAMRAE